LAETVSVEKVKEMLGDVVKSCFEKAQGQQKAEGYTKLERGFATIPLRGIDVPFHPRYLWAGVLPFRACMLTFSHDEFTFELIFLSDLSKKINPSHLNLDMLVGKYIPNLIAKPFDVSREYAQIIYDQTSSPKLDKKWEQEKWANAKTAKNLPILSLSNSLPINSLCLSIGSRPDQTCMLTTPVSSLFVTLQLLQIVLFARLQCFQLDNGRRSDAH
jgi:fatty acid synthase subunit alpha